MLEDTIKDGTGGGAATYASTYAYDGVGRLTEAVIPGHDLRYGFGAASCGVTAAGEDGNRTSYEDLHTSGGSTVNDTTESYCYDAADRLTGATVADTPTGADALLTNLTQVGPSASLAYDARGALTTLGDEALSYNAAGQHTETTDSTGADIKYLRDATGGVYQETTTASTGASPVTVDYTGPFTINDTTHAIRETSLSLPGGVSMSLRPTAPATSVWSFPDLHGDVVVTTDGAGVRQGQLAQYDPFGDPIDPATGCIGTIASDDAVPDNTTTPGEGYGWKGSHSKQYDHVGGIAAIEMGVRVYLPLLGRFASVDPVAGGNSNDYNYPNDPVDANDLTGQRMCIDTCYADTPQTALRSPAEGSVRGVGRSGNSIRAHNRYNANLFLSSFGLELAVAGGASCGWGPGKMVICTGANFEKGSTMTLGNVIVTSNEQSALVVDGTVTPLFNHEQSHATESALEGNGLYAFSWVQGYLASGLFLWQWSGHGGGCLNPQELAAKPGGGYEGCALYGMFHH